MMKNAIAMILAALTTTTTASAPTATAIENKPSHYRTDTAIVTGIEWTRDTVTSTFATPDGNGWAVCDELNPESEYIVVFDTMGTADLTDDEVIAMIPITE